MFCIKWEKGSDFTVHFDSGTPSILITFRRDAAALPVKNR
jgi:hypothetical protein